MPELKPRRRYNAVAGPGQWNLAVSYFERETPEPKTAEFTVEVPAGLCKVDVSIYGLFLEDGSGNNHLFSGRAIREGMNSSRVKLGCNYCVKGFINITTRRGWIEVYDAIPSLP